MRVLPTRILLDNYRYHVDDSLFGPRGFSANFLTRFKAQSCQSKAKPGQRMWLDLLVASGLGLPALLYGSLLFVTYMQ
jgi:hypothetical protein